MNPKERLTALERIHREDRPLPPLPKSEDEEYVEAAADALRKLLEHLKREQMSTEDALRRMVSAVRKP